MYDDESSDWGKVLKLVLIPLGIAALLFILNPFTCVSSTERGVKVLFGSVQDEIQLPGLRTHYPVVEQIKQYSIQPRQIEVKVPVGEEGAITKDNQIVGFTMDVFWRYDESKIPEIAKNYSEGSLQDLIIANTKSLSKGVIGRYTIFDIAYNQNEIAGIVRSDLESGVKSYPVKIVDVKINNYDWSKDFDDQINKTMARAQEVKQKEQELQVTTLEVQKQVRESEAAKQISINNAEAAKQKAILEAEAEKEAAKLRADGKVLEGEGIRKFNESISARIGTELELRRLEIERIKAEKWDGHYVPSQNFTPIPIQQGFIQGMDTPKK